MLKSNVGGTMFGMWLGVNNAMFLVWLGVFNAIVMFCQNIEAGNKNVNEYDNMVMQCLQLDYDVMLGSRHAKMPLKWLPISYAMFWNVMCWGWHLTMLCKNAIKMIIHFICNVMYSLWHRKQCIFAIWRDHINIALRCMVTFPTTNIRLVNFDKSKTF